MGSWFPTKRPNTQNPPKDGTKVLVLFVLCGIGGLGHQQVIIIIKYAFCESAQCCCRKKVCGAMTFFWILVELWDSVVFFSLSEFGVPTVPGWLDLAGWLAAG